MSDLVRRLRGKRKWHVGAGGDEGGIWIEDEAADRIEQQEQLIAQMVLQAQSQAQEARTANATIAEIYQLCTGSSGEPGNWNGAEPVRKRIEHLEAQLAEANALLNEKYGEVAKQAYEIALLKQSQPPQPPCTNEFVAEGCELFPAALNNTEQEKIK